jgi:hypothetical protein
MRNPRQRPELHASERPRASLRKTGQCLSLNFGFGWLAEDWGTAVYDRTAWEADFR